MSEQIEVNIEDLLLDHENPRLGTVDSQPEALRELVELSSRYFETMMLSIKDDGLDPGDLFYVIDESAETGIEGYTVVDGNRRLAAVKVLREPAVLVGAGLPESTIKRLREAAQGFDANIVGETRLSILFENREAADSWILRRHGRGMEGEGRISWGPLEIQRFQGDRSLLDILDFVARNGVYGADEWPTVRSKLEKRSSALRRFLESKAGREALGIGEESVAGVERPTSTREASYLLRILKRMLDDVISGVINTRKFNKASDIGGYFKSLPTELNPDRASTAAAPRAFHDLRIAPATPPVQPAPRQPPPQPPTTRIPRIRETLAQKQLQFRIPSNAKGQQFIREATSLKLRNAPLSAAFLLRGFIQFVIDTYMVDNGLPFREGEKQLELNVRAERVFDHLIQNKRAKSSDLNGIRRRLAEPARKNPASIQALNDYHHDQFQIPTADVLRAGWDDASALFVAVLGRAGS